MYEGLVIMATRAGSIPVALISRRTTKISIYIIKPYEVFSKILTKIVKNGAAYAVPSMGDNRFKPCVAL